MAVKVERRISTRQPLQKGATTQDRCPGRVPLRSQTKERPFSHGLKTCREPTYYIQCWGSYFESIALQAANYFTLEVVELQQSYSREKSSLVN